jgi:predicted ATPase
VSDSNWPSAPLTEIYLRNFKSVVDQRLSLSPLTLIIGPNSSGKTNLIRALLALTQTVASHSHLDGFLLNGERINLGAFGDVLHQGAQPDSAVSIGVSAQIRLNSPRYVTYPADYEYLTDKDELFHVQCELTFSGTDADDPMMSPAQGVAFGVSSLGSEGTHTRVVVNRRAGSSKPLEPAEIVTNDFFWPRGLSINTQFRGTASRDGTKTRVSGVHLSGLLPTHLICTDPANEALAKAWVDVAARSRNYGYVGSSRASREKVTPETLLALSTTTINDWLSTRNSNKDGFFSFVLERIANAGFLGRKLPIDTEDIRQKLIEEIRASLKSTKKVPVLLGGPLGIELRAAGSALQDLFAHRVWHLAGLREAPLPLYQASPAVRRGEIGTKGEYVAALQALKDRTIDCPKRDGGTERMSLTSAVQYWAEELELFSAVESHHLLTLGLGITVLQPGLSQAIDITSVGLGVSQLLPVLVRCLLAEPGDVVLLEQPELHLHPASQQRLADFVLACSRSGRQLIIESHSEHLVNRLRLRAAEDKSVDSEIARSVGIIFAERDLASGATTYRRTNLNEFGGFDEWPAGFFEPGITEAQQILAAGLEKLQRENAEESSPPSQ